MAGFSASCVTHGTIFSDFTYIYIHIILLLHLLLPLLPVVPHKAVAEVSKIENLWERLVVVMHGWQSELMHHDAPKRG